MHLGSGTPLGGVGRGAGPAPLRPSSVGDEAVGTRQAHGDLSKGSGYVSTRGCPHAHSRLPRPLPPARALVRLHHEEA